MTCPLSLTALETPCCLLPMWTRDLGRSPAICFWKQFIRFLKRNLISPGLMGYFFRKTLKVSASWYKETQFFWFNLIEKHPSPLAASVSFSNAFRSLARGDGTALVAVPTPGRRWASVLAGQTLWESQHGVGAGICTPQCRTPGVLRIETTDLQRQPSVSF